MPQRIMRWHRDGDDIAVQLGHRRDAVPPELAEFLIGSAQRELTDDVAEDLLGLHAELQKLAIGLGEPVDRLGAAAITAKNEPGATESGLRKLDNASQDHVVEQRDGEVAMRKVGAAVRALREFVIDFDPPVGPLADAAAEWRLLADADVRGE